MENRVETKTKELTKRQGRRKVWQRIVAGLAAVTVFVTTYAMILPAITQEAQAYCGHEEHAHTEACYEQERVLICEQAEEGHTHTEACYEEREVYVCGQEEAEPHTHDDACYEERETYTCGPEETEGHTHTEACYQEREVLSCEKEETEGHAHTDACYEERQTLTCTEEHEHGEACYTTEKVLTCEQAEAEAHAHTAACYTTERVLTCETEEKEAHTHTEACMGVERVLACEKEETEGHTHTEACKGTEKVLTCEQTEAEAHEHTDACYAVTDKLVCEQEEHAHTLQCFSNPNADVETAAAWERTFRSVELTGVWSDDVLAIAKTQIGYKESKANYEVNAEGEAQGYTRYGAKFNQPYIKWCAAFVSFCLEYAKVDKSAMPQSLGTVAWVDALQNKGLYREADNYTPNAGDLIFFDFNEDGVTDHVGLISDVLTAEDVSIPTAQKNAETEEEKEAANALIPAKVKTIEGNQSSSVKSLTYDLTDARIYGYGALPNNPNADRTLPEDGETPENPADPENSEEPDPELDAEDGEEIETPEPAAAFAGRSDVFHTFTATAENGVVVTMTAPESSLPFPADELTLAVSLVEDEAAKALVEDEANDAPGTFRETVLFDIRLLHETGEVEPISPVSVTFAGMATPNNDAQVFHVDPEAETAEEVAATTDENGEITMETPHFSVYGVTWAIGPNYVPGAARVERLGLTVITGTPDGKQADGVTDKWDADDANGNDSGPDNDLVRSFDTIFYNIAYTLKLNDYYEYLSNTTSFGGFKTARMYVRATMPLTEDKAVFDKDAMPWLTVVDEVSDLTHQEIFGYYEITAATDDEYIVPSAGTMRFAVFVKGMQDTDLDAGSLVQPEIRVWIDDGANAYHAATANETVIPDPVRVSSTEPPFNVRLEYVGYEAADTINFTDGTYVVSSSTENNGTFAYHNARYLLTAYNVIFETILENSEKGHKGTFLDTNTISFELFAGYERRFRQDATSPMDGGAILATGNSAGGTYRPRLWDFSPINGAASGALGRDVPLHCQQKAAEMEPFSSRSLSSEPDPTVNAVKDSGTMLAQEKSSTDYTIQVSFSGFDEDGVYPSKAAKADNEGNWNALSPTKKAIATGTVYFYLPIPATATSFYPRHEEYFSVSANQISVADNVSDHSRRDFIVEWCGHGTGNNSYIWVNGGSNDKSYLALFGGDRFVVFGNTGTVRASNERLFGGDFAFMFDGTKFRPDITRKEDVNCFVATNGPLEDPSNVPFFPDNWDYRVYFLADYPTTNNGWDFTMGVNVFNSLEELEATGKICNAVWVEVHSQESSLSGGLTGRATVNCEVPFRVRKEAPATSLPGTTSASDFLFYSRAYQNLWGSATNPLWNVPNTIEAYNGSFSNKPTATLVYTHLSGTQYDNQNMNWSVNGLAGYISLAAPTWSWDNEGRVTNYTPGWRLGWGSKRPNGWTGPGRTDPHLYQGIHITILGAKPQVTKEVAQQKGNGDPRDGYFVTDNERLVDYEISPALLGGGVASTVTVTETLPAGLVYQEGSAYLGGTYTQPADRKSAGTHSGGTALADNDTVTDVAVCEGVTDGTVALTVSNGGRTLVWTITGVLPGKEMPKLYYTAYIGDPTDPYLDVKDGDVLSTRTEITSDRNSYAVTGENGMVATAAITIHKLAKITLIKKVEKEIVNRDEQIRFTIDMVNDSSVPIPSVEIRDILPHNGDPRGTNFAGDYVVNAINVEKVDNTVPGTWSIRTTTDTTVRNYHGDVFNAAVDGVTYTPNFTANSKPTLISVQGTNVGAYAKVRVTITIKPTGNADQNVYYNDAALNGTETLIPSPVYAVPVRAKVEANEVVLTVKKVVDGGADTTTAFPMELTIGDGTGTTKALAANVTAYTLEDGVGKITFGLKHNGELAITLPSGATVGLKETAHDGYMVSIAQGANAATKSDSVTGIALSADETLTVTNLPGSVLPKTGGPGTGIYTLLGAALLLFGACGAVIVKKRE